MSTSDPRIDVTLRRDLVVAVAFTVAMWVALVFAYVEVLPIVPGRLLPTVLGASMVVLGGFNTASIVALARRYRSERESIYGEDLRHLDAIRANRARRREVGR